MQSYTILQALDSCCIPVLARVAEALLGMCCVWHPSALLMGRLWVVHHLWVVHTREFSGSHVMYIHCVHGKCGRS